VTKTIESDCHGNSDNEQMDTLPPPVQMRVIWTLPVHLYF